MRGDGQGDVEPVDERDTVGGEVVVAVVKGELCQRGWCGPTESVAFQAAAAVTRDAGELAVGFGAAGSGPDPARPVLGRSGEGAVGEAMEIEAATFEDWVAGVGLNGRPDGEGAVVD